MMARAHAQWTKPKKGQRCEHQPYHPGKATPRCDSDDAVRVYWLQIAGGWFPFPMCAKHRAEFVEATGAPTWEEPKPSVAT